MACFIVPLTQAIATSLVRRQHAADIQSGNCNRWMKRLPLLESMLWGGSLMLIVDHIINGEVTLVYPFFTALEQEDGALTMLREMLTVGLPMSAVVTLLWAGIVAYEVRRARA